MLLKENPDITSKFRLLQHPKVQSNSHSGFRISSLKNKREVTDIFSLQAIGCIDFHIDFHRGMKIILESSD